MLPVPIRNFLPKFFRENLTPSGEAFCAKLDQIILDLKDEILGIENLRHPERCPADFLDLLGEQLAAGIKDFDSSFTKRSKIANAIQSHKTRGTWSKDVRQRIKNITGLLPDIFNAVHSDDWILLGNDTDPAKLPHPWAIFGGDGFEESADGFILLGQGDEIENPGIVSIDLKSDSLSPTIISQIRSEISDDALAAYLLVNLGFVDSRGSFNVYPNGTIE